MQVEPEPLRQMMTKISAGGLTRPWASSRHAVMAAAAALPHHVRESKGLIAGRTLMWLASQGDSQSGDTVNLDA